MVAYNHADGSYLKQMKNLLPNLRKDFPDITFVQADKFYWSPKDQTVYYDQSKKDKPAVWALIHELSHGLLSHKTYKTDFELLQLEVAAWDEAKNVANRYKITIDEEHVQDCLDTYRDWLHARSKCPSCGEHGLQDKSGTYQCINCDSTWHVSSERFCRPYRRKA